MRPINEVIIHCTATRPEWWADRSAEEKVREVRDWHLKRGFNDVGYHWLIDRDGTVVAGRPEEKTGAHVKGHNTGTIGISLFGGHGSSADDQFSEHFTWAQEEALRNLIQQIEQRHNIRKISGHNEYSTKACPGFRVVPFLHGKKEPAPRTSVTQSKTMQASAVQVASGAGAAVTSLSMLDGNAQYIVLGFAGLIALMGVWIMRERLKKWAAGIK